MKGISALIKEIPENSLIPPTCEGTRKTQVSMSQEGGPHKN